VLRASKPQQAQLLDLAEQRLASGDVQGAQKLAQDALNRPDQDTARALFVLARAATLNRDVQGARTYFERTLAVAREPRLVAWSHIYLGRIFDLQENREAALRHYRAALATSDVTTEAKAAAERGLQQPYQPPVARRREEQEKP
jgi:tetratricopeptide (TPR) repeat protein